jgi:hypothetical protein
MKKSLVVLGIVLVGGLVYLGVTYPKGGFGAPIVARVQTWFDQGLKIGQSGGNPVLTFNGAGALTGNLSTTGDLSASNDITATDLVTAARYASASVGSSSSSPAALGSAVSGHFIVAASASTASASTTAVTSDSAIILQQEQTTPIAGTTCNASNASGTMVTAKVVGNGFTMKTQTTAATNPYCFSYWIIN